MKHLANDADCPSKESERERERGGQEYNHVNDSYVDAKIVFTMHGSDSGMACKETLSLKNSASIHLSCRI
jgi:hypothetical protein